MMFLRSSLVAAAIGLWGRTFAEFVPAFVPEVPVFRILIPVGIEERRMMPKVNHFHPLNTVSKSTFPMIDLVSRRGRRVRRALI